MGQIQVQRTFERRTGELHGSLSGSAPFISLLEDYGKCSIFTVIHGVIDRIELIMNVTWKELTVSFQKHCADDLLRDWHWLVGNSMQLLIVSSLGDMFLADAEGRVFWLDTGAGSLQQVAKGAEDFKQLMQQRENAAQWFVPQLVGDLIAAGVLLGAGQCYSYKTPPVLGGQIEPDNFEPTDLSVHFSILGQIHWQVKNLPPGTSIATIKFEKPR